MRTVTLLICGLPLVAALALPADAAPKAKAPGATTGQGGQQTCPPPNRFQQCLIDEVRGSMDPMTCKVRWHGSSDARISCAKRFGGPLQ